MIYILILKSIVYYDMNIVLQNNTLSVKRYVDNNYYINQFFPITVPDRSQNKYILLVIRLTIIKKSLVITALNQIL